MSPARAALLVVAGYMLVRSLVYAAMPSTDFDSWFRRDLVMTAPRLAAFAACGAIIHRNGGWRRWGWTGAITARGALLLALSLANLLNGHWLFHSSTDLGASRLALGWLSSVPVALFEEAAFRSLLFLSLRERHSPLAAATLSSLAFTVFHVQAQPLFGWPQIFVFGLAACAALERGTGVWAIALEHLIADGLWYHFRVGPGDEAVLINYLLLLITTPLAATVLLAGSKRRAAEVRT